MKPSAPKALLLASGHRRAIKRVEDSLTVTAGQPSAATSTAAPPTGGSPDCGGLGWR